MLSPWLLLLLSSTLPSLNPTDVMISPHNNDDVNSSNDDDSVATSIATTMVTDAIILQHLSKNYDASSATLVKVSKKWRRI